MLERNELGLLKQKGIEFSDPFDVVTLFEERVAAYIGAPYAVAVDCCSHAIELSLRYLNAKGSIEVPKRTYVSVPMTVLKLQCQIQWVDREWKDHYSLSPYPVVDASMSYTENSYIKGTFFCLSFQQKKRLPIGRGGMILTSDAKAAEWLRRASYDGRTRGRTWKQDPIQTLGYHYYMTPEDAARGILLMDEITNHPLQTGHSADYPDLSKLEVFHQHGS